MSLQVKFPFGRNHGPVHTCRDCGYATKERHLFDSHVNECPRGLPVPVSNAVEISPRKELPAPPVCRNYKCRKCEFATSKAKQYLFHLREVHKENITIYPCDLCEYAAKHRSKVIRHRTLVHKGAPAGDIDRLQTEPSEMEHDTSDYIVSDEEPPETVFVYQHSRPGGSTEIVFPGGGVPPPVPHILEQNIPAPVDAAEYSGPSPMEDQEGDEEDEEEEDMSGLEMDDEDPEIMFRVFSPDVGIELPEGQERPLVASDLPHNPHPTEDAYNYIIPAPGVEEGLLFKCKMCPYKNPHKWKIASHIRTIHMKRKLFKCPYCDFVCERKIEWCVHKTSHTNKTVYSCKECLYRTTMKRNFDRHLNRHLTRGPYKCGICTYSSTGEAAIQRHQAEYHIESSKENTSPPLSCSSSSVAADESSDRFSITDTARSPSTPSTPSTPKHTGSAATSDVICRICGQLFRSEAKLRIHMVAHSSVAPWSCPSCPLRYKRPADLNRHMKRKHGRSLQETKEVGDLDGQDEPLNLSVMKTEPVEQDAPLDLSLNSSPASDNVAARSRLYAASPDLEKACKALVFKPESLKCSHCSYQAKWPSDLRRHMLVHSIEKRFRCQFCNKRYKYQFDLNMHIRKTHRMSAGRTRVSTSSTAPAKPVLTAEQQLQLEWNTMVDVDPLDGLPTMVPQRRAWETPASSASSSGSSSSSPPSRSPAIGTLVSPKCKLPQDVACTPVKLKCDYCPYVGKYRAEVERHMRLHTGNKPYCCLFCEYKSFWKGDMKRHLSKHHQGEVSQHGDLHELVNATYSPSSDVESSAAASRQKLEEEDESLLLDESIVKVEPLDADENPIYLQLEETNNNKVSYVSQYEQYDQSTVPIENMSFEAFEVEQPNAKPGDKKVFKCPQCAFVCEAPSKLKCHYEIHSNLKRYMCPTCGKRSNWLWDVRKHIRKDHPSASMEVTELTEEAASATLEDYLMTHRSPNKTPRETPTREIPTPPAGVLSSEVAALLELRIHSRDVSPAKSTTSNKSQPGSRYRPFKCAECGRRSNWRWDLNKHIRTSNHPDAKVIVLDEEEAKATFEDEVVRRNREESPMPLKPLTPVSLQPVDIARLSSDRCRPFKCSKCGRRSNWKWDMSKHIRCNHPNARLIILSQEEARRTIDDYLKAQQQEQQQLQRKLHQQRCQKRKAAGDWKEFEEEEEEEDGEMEMEEDDREDDSPAIRSALLRPSASNPGLHHHVDIQKLKRFKCSACPYRSNFRSDIGRHIKRKHINLYAKVTQLGYDEAATTLKQYRDTFAKKKFVPSPSKSVSSGTLESSPETSPINMIQPPQTGDRRQRPVPLAPSDEKSDKSRFWKCTKCQFKSKNKMRVVKHYRKHARGMAFLCRLCGETSDYRTSMYRHIRSKHHRQDFDRTVELTAVQLVQTSKDGVETVLQSPEINNNNNTDSAMAKYVWKNYSCRLCGSSSIYKGTIVRHIREKHQIEDALPHVETESRISNSPPKSLPAAEEETDSGLKCDMCPFQTTKEGLLQMHKTYHKPQAGNRYKCKYCPYFVAATRMLRQHTRLHLKEQGLAQDGEDAQEEMLTVDTPSRYSAPSTPDSKASGRARHFCDRCPYVSINRNDYLYHKQFHRPKPTAPYKCEVCPYWVSQRRLLTQHQKVHQPGYRDRFTNGWTGSVSGFSSPAASPCKSLNTDLSSINVVQTAHIKQRIIAGKITSVPITPEKLQTSGVKEDDVTMPGYIVNRNGVLVSSGAYKKLHKCKSCPYTNVRLHNLKLHEKMHGYRKASLLKCQYCDYYVGNKGLLAHHVKVHSQQYRPGHDIINDFETEKENQQGEESIDTEEGGQNSEPEEENNNIVEFKDVKPSFRPQPGTQLSASALPNKSSYYIKYDDQTGEHILERAIFKKWCCEKCPYATMKKAQFERHSMLHGSKQKYTCEYCDYSVPGYHLLLQHKKLHMLPNPNLLSVQSISNLHHLPEVPADIAAAANFPADEDDPSLALHDHLSLYENTPYFTEPKKLYRCDRCPYTNVRRDHLLAHLKFHMIRNEMTCPYCDYSVSKVHLLNQHIKVHFNTPGGEMSAQSAAEAASDGASPRSVAAASDGDQPEFIDISELGNKIKKDTSELGPSKDKEEAGAGKMETETEAVKEGKKKDDEQEEAVMESSGEETVIDGDVEETADDADKETVEGSAGDDQPAPCVAAAAAAAAGTAATAADGGDEDEAKQSDEDKAKDCPDKETLSEDGKKDGEDSWVCQYCDRAFGASDKLLRHEMQHLVGNKF